MRWLVYVVPAAVTVVAGAAGYVWLRKKAPALTPSLGVGVKRFAPFKTATAQATEQGTELSGIKLATAKGPAREVREGRRDADNVLASWGSATHSSVLGHYVLEWQSRVWITKKPELSPQYHKWGGVVWSRVRATALDWPTAKAWLTAMAEAEQMDLAPEWLGHLKQYAVVNPWPAAGVEGFKCGDAPTGNVIKNAACGRYRGGRKDLRIEVAKSKLVPGWWVASWPLGPLAAGPDYETVKGEGYYAAKRINEGRP
jgi:hypothetical protein